jgi:uncharacterized protein YbaR (Trm112 family)
MRMQPMEKLEQILEMIVCPACQGRLRSEGASSVQNSIRCVDCGKSYPVEDGIPVLLASRASQP